MLVVFVIEVMVGQQLSAWAHLFARRQPLALLGKHVNAVLRWVGYFAMRATDLAAQDKVAGALSAGVEGGRSSSFFIVAAGVGWRSDAPKGLGG